MNERHFCLAVRIMTSLLILLFLREVTGDTFFQQYETDPPTQTCNKSVEGNKTAWWVGAGKSSLQRFERRYCDNEEKLSYISEKYSEGCPNEVHLGDFRGGGIFACKTLMENSKPGEKTPLFTSKEDCKDFNFYIVAIINNTPEQHGSENTRKQSEKVVSIEEKENFTLSCEFELRKGTTTFAVYWFKETKPSTCLFSVSNEDYQSWNKFDPDIGCCIDEALKVRRINSSTTSGLEHQHQNHTVTITSSTTSDSGVYFCVVAARITRKYRWTIESRVSVSVRPSFLKIVIKISLAVIAAVLLIGGIILFLCWKKSTKGKPSERQERELQTTVATEDCSPYAISTRREVAGNETVYSLATGPVEIPPAACSLPESNPTSGVQHEENVQALYSKVVKDKTCPPLAPDEDSPNMNAESV